eukprot:scaffold145304_cov62-Cyclotella_meneghiniana.AAC.2
MTPEFGYLRILTPMSRCSQIHYHAHQHKKEDQSYAWSRQSISADKESRRLFKEDHQQQDHRRLSVLDSFINVITSSNHIPPELKENTTGPADGIRNAPRALYELGGPIKSFDKRQLVSLLCFEWVLETEKTGGRNPKCPKKQPGTVMTALKTLFSVLKDNFDWQYVLEQDFQFAGGLSPCIEKLFAMNHSMYGSLYGTMPNRQIIHSVSSSKDVDLTVFNTNDALQLMMAVLVIHGIFFGFRGYEEHAKHMRDQLKEGVFEKNHDLEGIPFMEVVHMPDKTCKLTTTNTCLRQGASARIPIFVDQPNCPGMILRRYKAALAPGQVRMYCKIAGYGMRNEFAMAGHNGVLYSPNQPIGKHKLGEIIRDAAKMMGFDVAGHAFRRLFITSIVNAEGVSTEESLASSRHSSVAAQRPYQQRNSQSEMAKFRALGLTDKK